MKQLKSNLSTTNKALATLRDQTIALYPRISREDGADESLSIANQKKLLTACAKRLGFTKLLFFVDDGITGTRRDRKEFVRMTEELKRGHIGAVMVKDLSRLGRDHIRMDEYIEEFLPEHDIRFISIGDGIDTAEGEDEFIALRNWVNERYSRDISKKRRLTNVVKGNEGIPLSPPPYGYIRNPDNPKFWVVDEEVAPIVQRIFKEFLSGRGTDQIAGALEKDEILTPMNYAFSKGIMKSGRRNLENPCRWNSSTVIKVLTRQEYCGDIINFKTYSKSYKLKKRIPNAVEDMAIFHEVHTPIVSREDFERVQTKRGKSRKRKSPTNGEINMFSGLLVCPDCGGNLGYHFNQKNHDITFFNCTRYNRRKSDCPTSHYIRVDFLEQIVLAEVRRLTKFASQYEDEFSKLVMGFSRKIVENDKQSKQKEFNALISRDRELDTLFNRMYEDNIAGKIDDERFARMSKAYTEEQAEISEKVKILQADLQKSEDKEVTAEMFISNVRRYTRARKLTAQMLNELIDKIEVYHIQKINGENVQVFNIYWACVGIMQIPDLPKLPKVDVTMNTRKGVNVTYSPQRVIA